MNSKNIYKILYTVSLLFLVGFAIMIGIDYYKYDDTTNSAPFSAFVIVRVAEFIIPSVIIFIIAKIVKKLRR